MQTKLLALALAAMTGASLASIIDFLSLATGVEVTDLPTSAKYSRQVASRDWQRPPPFVKYPGISDEVIKGCENAQKGVKAKVSFGDDSFTIEGMVPQCMNLVTFFQDSPDFIPVVCGTSCVTYSNLTDEEIKALKDKISREGAPQIPAGQNTTQPAPQAPSGQNETDLGHPGDGQDGRVRFNILGAPKSG